MTTTTMTEVDGWSWSLKRKPLPMVHVPSKSDWSDVVHHGSGAKRPHRTIRLIIGAGKSVKVNATRWPDWPLQCQGNVHGRWVPKEDHGRQCQRMAYPGTQFCRWHDGRTVNLVHGTRRYLMWILAGAPEIHVTPIAELVTIEAVIRSILERQYPGLTDLDKLNAATLLFRVVEWHAPGRSKMDPVLALEQAGFSTEDAQTAALALWRAGWLPDPQEDVH